MKRNYNNLRERAQVIRKEKEDGANTSERVGGLMEDMVDTAEDLNKKVEGLGQLDISQAVERSEEAARIAEEQANIASQSGALAQYAKEQGDYAKVQGDLIEQVAKDLSIQIARFNDRLYFRINAVYENGYIVLLRKKKMFGGGHNISKMDETIIYKNAYVMREFHFKNRNKFETAAIKVSGVKPGVWTEFDKSKIESLIEYGTFKKETGYRFIGPVYPKPAAPTAGSTQVAYLKAGLQYIIVNPDYLDGIKENEKVPKRIIANGEMSKMKIYLTVEKSATGVLSYKLLPVPQDY